MLGPKTEADKNPVKKVFKECYYLFTQLRKKSEEMLKSKDKLREIIEDKKRVIQEQARRINELKMANEKLIAKNVKLQKQLDELQQDLDEIKHMLLESGGLGVGNGWVEATNVFLAPFDKKVLTLLCEGLSRKDIAYELDVTTTRIDNTLTRLFREANVSNRTELVRWAISTGNVKI